MARRACGSGAPALQGAARDRSHVGLLPILAVPGTPRDIPAKHFFCNIGPKIASKKHENPDDFFDTQRLLQFFFVLRPKTALGANMADFEAQLGPQNEAKINVFGCPRGDLT